MMFWKLEEFKSMRSKMIEYVPTFYFWFLFFSSNLNSKKKLVQKKSSYHLDWLHQLEQHLVALAILHGFSNGPIDVSMFRRNHAFCVNGHDQNHHLFRDQLMDLHHSFDSCHYHFGSPYNWSTVMIALLVRSAAMMLVNECHSVRNMHKNGKWNEKWNLNVHIEIKK